MKIRKYLPLVLLIAIMFIIESCGPVIITSRSETPPPPWFYPNRIQTVRYVYFPEYMIYYDLSLRNYIYLENNVWVTVNVLPHRYSRINLGRSKFIRVKGYRGNNISRYHRENNINRGRSNKKASARGRRN